MGGNYQQLRDSNKFLNSRKQVEAWPCQMCSRGGQSLVVPKWREPGGREERPCLPFRTAESLMTKPVGPSQGRNEEWC